MSGVEVIGMVWDSCDIFLIEVCNEVQVYYLNVIDNKQLIFVIGEVGCGKIWISVVKVVEVLIYKDVDRIIVICFVLQVDEDFGFLLGDIVEKFVFYF